MRPEPRNGHTDLRQQSEVLRRNALRQLSQRQLRYAAYAWQPPKQGGDRRADDDDRADRD